MTKRERKPIARNEVTEIDTAAAEKDFGVISDAQNELLDLDQDLTLKIREYERLRVKVRKLMVEFGLLDGSNG